MTRGELARRGRVNAETLRYYERKGLIAEPPRASSGYRQYGEDAVARIRFIKRAQGLGFTLKEIAELLALRVDPETTCEDVRRQAEAKREDIEEKIRVLQAMKGALTRLSALCDGRGPTSECPILETLEDCNGEDDVEC